MTPASDPSPVYRTARGRLRGAVASRLARRARDDRHATFFSLTGAGPTTRILDVGCGALGLRAREPELDVTGLDIAPRPGYPGPFVLADATDGLPFGDDAFDLVYCNSVIEHIAPAQRERFAAEIRRVGRGWLVQTPARSFPIEPHALLPFAHWLPARLRKPYWRLGVAGEWEDVRLLGRAEMRRLFGAPMPERLGPIVKSWVTVRTVDGRPVGEPPTG